MDLREPMRFLGKISEFVAIHLRECSTRRFLSVIILFQFVTHIPILPLPPMGQHTWLQVTGLSVARNYYEEDAGFFYPRHDIRIDDEDKGIIYTAFQGIFWLVGQSYHLTGFSHTNGRMMALSMGILLIIGSYYLVRGLGFSETASRWYVFFLSCSPLFYYYSISLAPNMPGLAMFVAGLALMVHRIQNEKWDIGYGIGVTLLTLGTLTKPTYLFYGLPVAYLFIHQYLKTKNKKIVIATLLTGVVVLLPNMILYHHAMEVFNAAPFERQRHAELKPLSFPTTWAEIYPPLRFGINEWFLQMIVNTAAIPFFVVGCYQAVKKRSWRTEYGGFWVSWILGFIVFSVLFFSRYRQHAYYLTPTLMLAALGSTFGVQRMLKGKQGRRIAFVFLVFVPIVMVGRVAHRWIWTKQVPDELLYQVEKFQEVIPENSRVLILGDSTPNVFLYYLHRKGVYLPPNFPESEIQRYRQNGFDYVVSQIAMKELPRLNDQTTPIARIGDFTVLTFKKQGKQTTNSHSRR